MAYDGEKLYRPDWSIQSAAKISEFYHQKTASLEKMVLLMSAGAMELASGEIGILEAEQRAMGVMSYYVTDTMGVRRYAVDDLGKDASARIARRHSQKEWVTELAKIMGEPLFMLGDSIVRILSTEGKGERQFRVALRMAHGQQILGNFSRVMVTGFDKSGDMKVIEPKFK